ncbi:zinc finger and BTB domain-containing protein 17-like [Culicoides brevitarsis]|uniref:zinc finger and BTB domain-containing protein 17-like n=1 Tax=Culicoides brevitarsis TaxID=469753 RepID=UPI00307B372B
MEKLLIKRESDLENCVICLRTDIQLLTEHEVRTEILSLYQDFINDYVENLQEIQTKICFECVDTLNSILEFRSKCITSVQILSTKVYRQPVVMLEDISLKNYETIEIKPEIFVEELPVTPVLIMKKPQKAKKVTKKPLKTKENSVSKPEIREIIRRAPQKTTYCYICCASFRQINLHVYYNHTIERENNETCCALCLESYDKMENLYEHQKNSHFEYENLRRCGKCDEIETKSREEYINHVHKTHYPNKKRIYICDFCPTVYLDKVFFKAHIWQHQGGLKCDHCHEVFFDMTKRQEHIEKHIEKQEQRKEILFICHFCDRKTNTKAAIKMHLFNKHAIDKIFKCEKCDTMFKTKKRLSDHVLRYHTEQSAVCPHCGKKCSNAKNLKRHVSNNHEGTKRKKKNKIPLTREFACDECDAKFLYKSSLKKHKFSHSKTRPYNCHMCFTGYYMNEYLRNHYLRVHGVVHSAKEIRKMNGFKLTGDSDTD